MELINEVSIENEKTKLSVASYTLGCKVNKYESDAVVASFIRNGYILSDIENKADVYILNTCSVTGEAGRKSGQILRKLRKQNPKAVIVAMGCHIQLGGFNDVADIIVGTQGKNKIFQAVETFIKAWQDAGFAESSRPPVMDLSSVMALSSIPEYEELGVVDMQSETRAYIKIQDGCNNFCSFCTIPFARGRVRSRLPKNVLAETAALAASGYKEVVLTGIHVCSYGEDFNQEDSGDVKNLIDLVDKMKDIKGLERIRLGSLEPLSINKEFIRRAAANPLVCPHFHLSLQSGCTATLKRMRRRYTADDFMEVVHGLREAYGKEVGITTDIIVGFPGESDEEFAQSLAFCEAVGFSRMHIFRYSERKGTAAVRYPNKVSAETAMQRSKEMADLNKRLQNERNKERLGKKECLILEQKNRDGLWEGYTPAYDSVILYRFPEQNSADAICLPDSEFEAAKILNYDALSSGMMVECKVFGSENGNLKAYPLELK